MSDEQTETTTEQAEKKFRLQTIISDTDVVTLRKVSDPVALALGDNSGRAYPDRDTQELIEALKEYVVENNGLGMAGIQLGVAQRVFVMRKPFNSDNIIAVINPTIARRGKGKRTKAEGCFSIPNIPDGVKGAKVSRFTEVFVNFTDESGLEHKEELLVGMDARVFQHELDHLEGHLMLDDLTPNGRFMGWERSF